LDELPLVREEIVVTEEFFLTGFGLAADLLVVEMVIPAGIHYSRGARKSAAGPWQLQRWHR